MNPSIASTDAQEEAARASSPYHAVWRWHFCAGLACLPFLAMLAITAGVRSLAKALADANARLAASRLSKFSTFDGLISMDAAGHHPCAASGAKP